VLDSDGGRGGVAQFDGTGRDSEEVGWVGLSQTFLFCFIFFVVSFFGKWEGWFVVVSKGSFCELGNRLFSL